MKKTKVLTGGTFNIIHLGHIYFLEQAKRLGDELVVVIANDNSEKVFIPAKQRKIVLEALRPVDRVIVGSDKDKLDVVRREKPDIIALGYDDAMKISGFRTQRIKRYRNYSTSNILGKIRQWS